MRQWVWPMSVQRSTFKTGTNALYGIFVIVGGRYKSSLEVSLDCTAHRLLFVRYVISLVNLAIPPVLFLVQADVAIYTWVFLATHVQEVCAVKRNNFNLDFSLRSRAFGEHAGELPACIWFYPSVVQSSVQMDWEVRIRAGCHHDGKMGHNHHLHLLWLFQLRQGPSSPLPPLPLLSDASWATNFPLSKKMKQPTKWSDIIVVIIAASS